MKLKEPHWQHYASFIQNTQTRESVPIQDWLLDSTSLTQRLRDHSKTFRVEVLFHDWNQPFLSEQQQLEIKPDTKASIREVLLVCNDEPWVYARTVIPEDTLTGPEKDLLTLGTKPLGQLLYDDPTMKRSAFQLAHLLPCHYQYQEIMAHAKKFPCFENSLTDEDKLPLSCWGRRSLFRLSGKPLLVSEIFTPFFPFYFD